jgi:glucosamine--fructose-6-phosphate aminotransferase (isomerizing)
MSMIKEIKEIPERTKDCYQQNKEIQLPENVDYLGMGSSFYAAYSMKYMNVPVKPRSAADFFYYQHKNLKLGNAVLISQSGKSLETVWCKERLEWYVAITNEPDSPIGQEATELVEILSGPEKYSSTKSYVNTLIALYNGHQVNTWPAIAQFPGAMGRYDETGHEMAESIMESIKTKHFKGVYILGNGQEEATARQAALILSESTRLPFIAMTTPDYDHGPKETAKGSHLIFIHQPGPVHERSKHLVKEMGKAGAITHEVNESAHLPNEVSPLVNIMPLNFLAAHLMRLLGIQEPFEVGDKVTGFNP